MEEYLSNVIERSETSATVREFWEEFLRRDAEWDKVTKTPETRQCTVTRVSLIFSCVHCSGEFSSKSRATVHNVCLKLQEPREMLPDYVPSLSDMLKK